MAGATGAGLAKTGFNALAIVLVAVCLVAGGLLLLRVAAMRRFSVVDEQA